MMIVLLVLFLDLRILHYSKAHSGIFLFAF